MGWKYVQAYEPRERYKEGKFIIERAKIVKEYQQYLKVPFEGIIVIFISKEPCLNEYGLLVFPSGILAFEYEESGEEDGESLHMGFADWDLGVFEKKLTLGLLRYFPFKKIFFL